jgi:acyl carrier protein
VLRQDADVTDALVRLHGAAGEQQELVGYVVAPPHTHDGLAERVRARLAEQLPAHMLPGAIVVLPAWPLTANGKIDVTALPEPGQGRELLSSTHVAPEGQVETTIAAIWAELLERETVGAADNFFELGGHSLLVPMMLRRVADEFDVPLPLRTIFVAATVAELARKVDEERKRR